MAKIRELIATCRAHADEPRLNPYSNAYAALLRAYREVRKSSYGCSVMRVCELISGVKPELAKKLVADMQAAVDAREARLAKEQEEKFAEKRRML